MKNFPLTMIICFVLTGADSFSQAGTLDSSFGDDGIIVTRVRGNSNAQAVTIQPDGRIIAAGYCSVSGGYAITLVRYLPNGYKDFLFGKRGEVITNIPACCGGSLATSVALKKDGKIVVAGSLGFDIIVLQYKSNGRLDSGFGSNGQIISNFNKAIAKAYSVVIQPDDKIVVAGTISPDIGSIVVQRFTSDGKPDSTFSDNGIAKPDFRSTAAYSAALQKDGKIVLAGVIEHRDEDFALIRYQSDGNLDRSFGENGFVSTDFGDEEEAYSLVIQDNGKIIAAGSTDDQNDVALARYKANGKLDSSFGTNGKVTTDLGGFDYATSIALQPDGKIVAAGYSSYIGAPFLGYLMILLRYNINGTLDSSFGNNGTVITKYSTTQETNGMAIQPDGKIVVAGRMHDDRNDQLHFVVARYCSDQAAQSKTSDFLMRAKQSDVSNVYLSPNPVRDILHIALAANTGGSSLTKTISIIDAKGKLLQQVTPGSRSYSFDVKQLPAGVYLVRISDGQISKTLKFLKE